VLGWDHARVGVELPLEGCQHLEVGYLECPSQSDERAALQNLISDGSYLEPNRDGRVTCRNTRQVHVRVRHVRQVLRGDIATT